MAQTSNPYGFKLVYGKESQLSAGSQPYYIRSGDLSYVQGPSDALVPTNGIGTGDPVIFRYSETAGSELSGNISLAIEPWGDKYSNVIKDSNIKEGPPPYNVYNYTAGGAMVGIFGGCSYQPDQQGQPLFRGMWKSGTKTFNNTPAVATIQDHPFLVWQVQTNGSFYENYVKNSNTPIGLNYCFTYNKGVNTNTGQSTAQLFVYNNLTTTPAKRFPIGQPAGVSEGNQYAYFKIIGLAPIPNNKWTDPFVDVLVVINDHYLKAGTLSVELL
jgi:hypothetical protein